MLLMIVMLVASQMPYHSSNNQKYCQFQFQYNRYLFQTQEEMMIQYKYQPMMMMMSKWRRLE